MERTVILKVLVNEQEVRLISPVMNMKKAAGEHTQVKLTGILNPEDSRQGNNVVPELDVQIFDKGIDKILFHGIVRDVDIGVETVNADPMTTIGLEAVSGTYLLDRKQKKRSFQKTSMDYKSVAGLVVKDYEDAAIMLSPELDGLPLGRLIVQYQETDWKFAKRLMSRLNQPVIPNNNTRGSKFYAGIMGGGDIYEIKPEEENLVSERCYIEQGDEDGHLEYIWTSQNPDLDVMEVGDVIRYKMADYYIKAVDIEVKNSSIRHQYQFCLKSGFRVREIQNPYITGLALPGAVKCVSGDQVQVKLDMDAVQDSDCWYTYSTFYSSFYCMPEVGDRVQLYMPSSHEEQAFVLNSIRDKPASEESGGGKFSASSSGQQEEKIEQKGESENTEAGNLLSWLGGLSSIPEGQLMGVGISASGTVNDEPQTEGGSPDGQGGSSGGASYSSNGVQSQTPSFDFQNLYGSENVKVLSTKNGKMVILDDDNGSVTILYSNGTNIVLSGNGIQINSEGLLNLTASGNINISAEGALNIEADEAVSLACQGSIFKLTPDGVGVMGTDIKINE